MSEKTNKTHWGAKLALIGSLAGLFFISAAVEQPAEESCCPESADVMKYLLVSVPSKWDPAPWEGKKGVDVRLVDSATDQPVPVTSFSAEPVRVISDAAWTLETAQDLMSAKLNVEIRAQGSLHVFLRYLYTVARSCHAGKPDVPQYESMVKAISERNLLFALSCLESRWGTRHVRLAAVKDGKNYLGVFSYRIKVEEVPPPW